MALPMLTYYNLSVELEGFLKGIFFLSLFLILIVIVKIDISSLKESSITYHDIGRISSYGFISSLIIISRNRFKKKSNFLHSLSIATLLLSLFVLISTGHRSSFLGIILCSFFIFKERIRFNFKSAISILGLILFFIYLGDRMIYRLVAAISYSDSPRIINWVNGIDMWIQNPLFGKGFGSYMELGGYQIYRHAHNAIMETLSELGIIGLIFYSCIFYLPFFSKNKSSLIMALYVYFLVFSLVSGDITDNRLLLMFAILLFSLNEERFTHTISTSASLLNTHKKN